MSEADGVASVVAGVVIVANIVAANVDDVASVFPSSMHIHTPPFNYAPAHLTIEVKGQSVPNSPPLLKRW